LKIKTLKTAIDTSNCWRQRKKWRGSTKTRSNKCAKAMNLKWNAEDKITVISKKLILKDSMNYKRKKMKNQENLRND